VRIDHAEKRRDQSCMGDVLRCFQKSFKYIDCFFRALQNQFQTPAQKSPLILFPNRFGLHVIQNPAGIGSVSLIDVQLR
jgi:hypothetical protein